MKWKAQWGTFISCLLLSAYGIAAITTGGGDGVASLQKTIDKGAVYTGAAKIDLTSSDTTNGMELSCSGITTSGGSCYHIDGTVTGSVHSLLVDTSGTGYGVTIDGRSLSAQPALTVNAGAAQYGVRIYNYNPSWGNLITNSGNVGKPFQSDEDYSLLNIRQTSTDGSNDSGPLSVYNTGHAAPAFVARQSGSGSSASYAFQEGRTGQAIFAQIKPGAGKTNVSPVVSIYSTDDAGTHTGMLLEMMRGSSASSAPVVQFQTDGTMVFASSATTFNIEYSSALTWDHDGVGEPDRCTLVSGNAKALCFDAGATETSVFNVNFRNDATEDYFIGFIDWVSTDTATGTVIWMMECNGEMVGSAITAPGELGPAQTTIATGTAWMHYRTTFPNFSANSFTSFGTCAVSRGISDTYSGDAAVISAGFIYEQNMLGSHNPTTK